MISPAVLHSHLMSALNHDCKLSMLDERNDSVRMYIPSPMSTKGKMIFPVWRTLEAIGG